MQWWWLTLFYARLPNATLRTIYWLIHPPLSSLNITCDSLCLIVHGWTFSFLLCAGIISKPRFSSFPPYIGWTDLRSQPRPSRILLNRSDIPASVVSESDSPTSSGSAKGLAKKTKKQYEKWPQEEKKALVSLWAERHELLESKDARDLGRNCAWVKSQVLNQAHR